jgi:hypothetical protein
MWYAVYYNATGELHSVASDLGPGIPGEVFGAVPYETRPDLRVVQWDAAQRLFVAKPPAVRNWISVLEFTTERFTQSEQDRIERAMYDHPDSGVRANLRRLDKNVRAVSDNQVRLTDPRTIGGVQYLTTVQFEGAPLLAVTRVPQVLALPAA